MPGRAFEVCGARRMDVSLEFFNSAYFNKLLEAPMKLCGSLGFMSKSGGPCGYRIGDTAESCPHHAPGGSTAREFQLRGSTASKYNRIPSQIEAGDLDTTEAIRRVYADVITTAVTMKRID